MPETRPQAITTDRERSDRLHVFAHDLRNRLTGLWEVMKALRAGDPAMDPDELHAYAEKGYFQAQRQIEELLNDFQVDRDVRIVETSAIGLSDVLRSMLEREQHRLERKGQQVSIAGDPEARAAGDAHWIGQIIQALISNASKFSPKASKIEAEILRDGPRVLLRVTDPGVGMDAADLERVFVRFALLNSRSTDGEAQSRGTLARAKQWAAAMDGELRAHSDGTGQGATFTLTLPAAD